MMDLACDTPLGVPPGISGAVQLYAKTLHACRICGGRVLLSGETYSCSTCDAAPSLRVEGLCGCGMLTGPRSRSALFRCGLNPSKSTASPAQVVILFGDTAIAA